MKERRAGTKIGVNEAELAAAVKGKSNKAKAAIAAQNGIPVEIALPSGNK